MSIEILVEGLPGHGRKCFEGTFRVVVSLFPDFFARRDVSRWLVDVCLSSCDVVTESDILDVLWPIDESEKTLSFVLAVFATNLDCNSDRYLRKFVGELIVVLDSSEAEHLPKSCLSFLTSGSPWAVTSMISPSCVVFEDRLIQSSRYTGLAASRNDV